MMKQISTIVTFLVLPVILFGAIYFGMTFFSRTIEPSPTATEQRMLSPKEPTPSSTCGNGICEKSERDAGSCTEDC